MKPDVLQDCKDVKVYLDDIIIFGCTDDEHHHNLREVLRRISQAGLKLNSKCVFNVAELTFLGHNVRARGFLLYSQTSKPSRKLQLQKMSFRFAHFWGSSAIMRNSYLILRTWSNQCDAFEEQRHSSGTNLRSKVFSN